MTTNFFLTEAVTAYSFDQGSDYQLLLDQGSDYQLLLDQNSDSNSHPTKAVTANSFLIKTTTNSSLLFKAVTTNYNLLKAVTKVTKSRQWLLIILINAVIAYSLDQSSDYLFFWSK